VLGLYIYIYMIVNYIFIIYLRFTLEENIRKCGILAYADDIIILGSNKQEVIMGTKELIKNTKDIGLQIN
jgi:hypothetical protein